MAITSIKRDWGVAPAIVRITSTDAIAQVSANGYLVSQEANIELINSGAFDWLPSDMILVRASDGWAFYTLADLTTLNLNPLAPLVVSSSQKSVAKAAAAGGAAAQSFTDAFCTTASVVIGNWVTQANAASVLTIVPGNGSFVVTSSANAGVGTFSYTINK